MGDVDALTSKQLRELGGRAADATRFACDPRAPGGLQAKHTVLESATLETLGQLPLTVPDHREDVVPPLSKPRADCGEPMGAVAGADDLSDSQRAARVG